MKGSLSRIGPVCSLAYHSSQLKQHLQLLRIEDVAISHDNMSSPCVGQTPPHKSALNFSLFYRGQYWLSLVVEVFISLEWSCIELLRGSFGRQRSRARSSRDTLLEKAVQIHGFVQEFRLASNIRMVKATPENEGEGQRKSNQFQVNYHRGQVIVII